MPFKLIISDELRDFLRVIETQSLVAKLLLGRIDMHKEGYEFVDYPVNYISMSHDDRTKISYLTQDRVNILIKEGVDLWTTRYRYKARPGSFIKKLFKNIDPKEVERFSNLYCGESKKINYIFKVVSGEDIRKYYHYSSYAGGSGSLGVSCMRYDNCQAFLDIYVKNPDKIKLVAMLDGSKRLMGRSLLWEFDGVKLMDRIYTINDEVLQFQFKKWATENDYLYKSEQNWFNTLFFENMNKEKEELRFKVKLDKYPFDKYPYVDTFKFLDGKGNLYNYMPEDILFKTLCACDGNKYDSDFLRFDSIDRMHRHRGETVFLDYLQVYTWSNNVSYSEVNKQYILRKDSAYIEELCDSIFIGEYENLNNLEKIKKREEFIARKREEERIKREAMEKEMKKMKSMNLPNWFDISDNTTGIYTVSQVQGTLTSDGYYVPRNRRYIRRDEPQPIDPVEVPLVDTTEEIVEEIVDPFAAGDVEETVTTEADERNNRRYSYLSWVNGTDNFYNTWVDAINRVQTENDEIGNIPHPEPDVLEE